MAHSTCGYLLVYGSKDNIQPHFGVQVAQWIRSLDLTTHTSLSPIRRGFAPSFVNYKKWCTRLGYSWNIAESGIKTPQIKSNQVSLTSIFSVDVISCISAHGTIHFYDYQLTILFLTAAMHPHLLLCCQGLWGLMKLIVTYNIYSIVYIPLYCCRGKDLHRKSSVSYSIC